MNTRLINTAVALIFSVVLSAEAADTMIFPDAEDRPEAIVSYNSIPILKTVLEKSSVYTIGDQVKVDGYFYNFKLKYKEKVSDIHSVRKLIKTCHEIEVMDNFKNKQEKSQVVSGMGASAKTVGAGAVNLVKHPGVTAKKVFKGFGNIGRAFASPFRKKRPVIASSGKDLSIPGKGPAGGERRLLAYEMGIDVYSENESVQDFLNHVARKRLMGKLPIQASVFALPGGSVFTLSLTPMGHDLGTEELIRDKSPDALIKELGTRYHTQFGMKYGRKKSPVTALLNNPNYTPREQAYIWRYLNDLKALDDVDAAVKFLSQVDSPEKANIVSGQLELLSLLHQRAKQLHRFVPVRNTLGALSKDGTLCLVISIDTVRFWGDVRKSLELSIKAAKEKDADRIVIWSTGDVDKKSVEISNRLGVKVKQNILENPVFQKPRDYRRKKDTSAVKKG
ncbi:MAG: hypothetical protein ACYTFY_00025 [Planctomycetota bacterium]|jgi:hypothetical protein